MASGRTPQAQELPELIQLGKGQDRDVRYKKSAHSTGCPASGLFNAHYLHDTKSSWNRPGTEGPCNGIRGIVYCASQLVVWEPTVHSFAAEDCE